MDVSCLDLSFPSVANLEVVARFDGGDLTSDAGLVLLRQADRKTGVLQALASCIHDSRSPKRVQHSVLQMVSARVLAIGAGYEDADDLDQLRSDPALKLACDRLPADSASLASQPTISRLENSVGAKELLRMGTALARRVVAQLPADTSRVVLDVDATDDPCHGQQEFEGFNGFYDRHCYLPLHLYVTGPDGRQRLLASLLRPGKSGYRTGLFGLLRRAVKLVRKRFPDVSIILRADAGFGHGDVCAFCEKLDLDYVLGIKTNPRLRVLSTPVQIWAALQYSRNRWDCREFDEFRYKAGSWPTMRRVVAKVEITRGELNPRMLVTSLKWRPDRVYDYYCRRGDCENRIKEMKLDLGSGRTSCHRFKANQFRLLLHSAACVLMQTLQDALTGTKWQNAQAGTLRIRLLKTAARIVQTTRRIWFHLPSSCPAKDIWQHLNRKLSEGTT